MDTSLQLFTGNNFFRPIYRQVAVPSISGLSSLTDAQVIDNSGCFSFANSETTKNRFIIWRSSSHNLFLEEYCFGTDLTENAVCVQFQNSVVLPCTRIFETLDHTVILIATNSSIHRCVLPHPTSFKSKRDGVSVLSELSAQILTDAAHHCLVNSSGNVGILPEASDCVLSNSEEALFALARTDGSILLFTLPNLEDGSTATQDTLRSVSTVKRILTGLVTPFFLSQDGMMTSEKVFSVLFFAEADDVILCAAYNDFKLRCWSCKRKDIDFTFDLTSCFNEYQNQAGSQVFFGDKWKLRKLIDEDECYISVYSSAKNCGYFIFLSSSKQNDQRTILKIFTVEGFSDLELIDYTFTSEYLLTLHRLNEEFYLKYISIDLSNYERGRWVSKKIDFSDYVTSTFRMDIVDDFVDYVFHPCLFSHDTIVKALKICCKDFPLESHVLDIYRLKNRFKKYLQQIINGVQIRKRTVHEKSIPAVSFESITENLRSCLWQYHKAFSNISGIFSLPFDKNVLGLIAQDRFSLLVPVDKEILCSVHHYCNENLCDFGSGTEAYFVKSISLIQEWFDLDEKKRSKEFYLYVLNDKHVPNDLIREKFVVDFLADLSGGRTDVFRKCMSSCERYFYTSIDQLLNYLQPKKDSEDDSTARTAAVNLPSRSWLENLVSGVVRRSCLIRYQLCRNLMLFLQLCLKFQSKLSLPQEISTKFELTVLPALSDLCRYYCIISWLLTVPEEKLVDESEFNVESISNLKLIPGSTRKKNLRQRGTKFLFDNFFATHVRKSSLLSTTNRSLLFGSDSEYPSAMLKNLFDLSLKLLWPTGHSFDVYDFLADSNENLILFELCDALYPWCDEGKYVRFYVKGEALLRLDKSGEALTEFRKAYIGIKESDRLLLKRLEFESYSADDYSIQYFLKVAELFEQRGFNEPVIELCTDGLRETPKENKLNHMLWTLVFKHFLATQKFDKAFMAMQYNPEINSKKTCLRLFIVRLLEAKNFDKLISYQYGKFEIDFIEMLEFRARTADILQENYYNVLAAFFINKSNYRRAAFYFYELSQRYRFESVNSETLRCRIRALSVCVQNLSLATKEYRWIVCPSAQQANPACSPKRLADDETIVRVTGSGPISAQILEINDIRKELILAQANLTIANRMKIFSYLSPNEALTQLCHLKEFDTAAQLTVLFDLTIETVLEALTVACINIASYQQPMDKTKLDLMWLDTNRAFTNILSSEMKASDICWSILDGYLTHFAQFYAPTVLYRCVCRKLLSYSQHLPAWFSAAFKKIDFPEFLRILIEYNKLDEAATIVCDYINALLGVGMDDFGLQESLYIGCKPIFFPYSAIDLLLQLYAEDGYKNLHTLEKKSELETSLKEYFRHLSSVETAVRS